MGEMIADHAFLLNSVVVWAILALATCCYAIAIELCFFQKINEAWFMRTRFWFGSLQMMLSALPLLGLLGTISGLMKTFRQLSRDSGLALQELVSGGIGEALFTTQLGLVMVIPGLLLLALLHHQRSSWILVHSYEIVH